MILLRIEYRDLDIVALVRGNMPKNDWTTVIEPNSGLFDLRLKEIYKYRDLLWLFVKRDIVVVYKQTILGPLWYIIQPILTTLMFTFIFGRIAKIPTDGIPHIVFYLCGVTVWNYFSECLTLTSNTFVANQKIFGKVYFPRVLVPLSILISNLIKFAIQFCIFLIVWFFYLYKGEITPNWELLFLLPVVIIIMGGTSLGFGMLFSSMTATYRDLTFLLKFGVQLWMYGTPVIYSLSTMPDNYKFYIELNPITYLIETVRSIFLGGDGYRFEGLLYSSVFSVVILFVGFVVFSKIERKFMDTV